MQRIKAIVFAAFVTAALAGCSYSVDRTVTSTSYIPAARSVTTTTYTPAYAAPVPSPTTSQVVTTVTTGPDGTVRRTTTRYYYPGTTYTSYTVDDGLIASDVKTALRQDPGVNAHARNIAVASDAGTVEIVGTADSVSAVQQASWDAVQIPGVQQVNNDMRIDPTSPG